MLYWEYYVLGIILLPGIILAAYAQIKVNLAFEKYNKIITKRGDSAKVVARRILDNNNARDVQIIDVSGTLTDYYDPKRNVVALSSSSNEPTLSSLAVAAHEVGHAMQYKENYAPIKIRTFMVKLTNISSKLLWPLVIIGLVLNFAYIGGILGKIFVWAGVCFFGISILLNLITLPVEFNASKRALELLVETGEVAQDEIAGCKKVLSAAALTYVAALVVAILNFVRFIITISRFNRDEKISSQF